MPLESIPVHVEWDDRPSLSGAAASGAAASVAATSGTATAGRGALSGHARPLLYELQALLTRYLETGQMGAIDLTALPLTPADLDWLETQLGPGEIQMTLESQGRSTLVETGLPGVWWIRHYNEAGELLTQLLEVTEVPELARAHRDEMQRGRDHLELLLDVEVSAPAQAPATSAPSNSLNHE